VAERRDTEGAEKMKKRKTRPARGAGQAARPKSWREFWRLRDAAIPADTKAFAEFIANREDEPSQVRAKESESPMQKSQTAQPEKRRDGAPGKIQRQNPQPGIRSVMKTQIARLVAM
jgi:hypothetical protein